MTDTLSPQNAALKAKFGDIVENGWASEANPTRVGYFVRAGNRKRRMNGGKFWEITDGKGKFWELTPTGDHKITVTPVARAEPAKPADDELEGLRRFREFAMRQCAPSRHGTLSQKELAGIIYGYPLEGSAKPAPSAEGVEAARAEIEAILAHGEMVDGDTPSRLVQFPQAAIRILLSALPAQSVSGEQFAENAKCSAQPVTQAETVEPCFECGSTERIGTACKPCNPELWAETVGEPVAHGHDRHPFCQPGDEPHQVWILRFADQDMREMVWTDENARRDAIEAWNKFNPAWNCYLFATLDRSAAPPSPGPETGVE